MTDMIKKNIRRAVVLGGGGSKGSYEVGVWQAMREMGIDYHVVTGTSVGALNGALMTMGKFDESLEMWNHMDNSQVMSEIPAYNGDSSALGEVYRAFVNQILKKGGVDVSPLETTIRRIVDETIMRRSSVEFGIVTVEMATLRPVEWFLPQIPEGQLADYLLASAACFPAIKPHDIDGTAFIDGGYSNNIPINLALRAVSPVDEVIAVDVEGIGVVRRVSSDVPVITLRCYWDLGSILIFDIETIRRNIRLGYLDGMKLWGGYGGQAYTFAPGEALHLEERNLEGVSRICLKVLDAISGNEKREIGALVAGRIVNAATHRRVTIGGEIDLRELMLASGELAAELLGLPPTELYTAQDFDDRISRRMSENRADAAEAINSLRNIKTMRLKKLPSGWKKEHLLSVCRELLHRQMTDAEKQPVPVELLATLMPREFLASIYLESLACR